MRKALRHETLIAFVSRRDIRPRRLHLKIFVFQRTAMTTILFPHLHALSPLIHIPVSSCSDFQLRYPKECTCPSSVSLGSVGHSVVKGQTHRSIPSQASSTSTSSKASPFNVLSCGKLRAACISPYRFQRWRGSWFRA